MGQETRKRILEVRCPVTVPREIGSLGRMNDDGTNIIVSQQRRDLVFGDWASAAIFVPRRVWIGEELLHHLLRCYFRAVIGERRPQSRQQLYSDAWLIWSAREVNRGPTCLFGPTATSMLRNLQQQFPIGVQPIVKTWRLRWLQVLDDTDVVGSPPCELALIVENSGSSAYAKSSAFSSGFLGHILRIILRLAIVRGNLVLPRMPRIFGQNGSYQRPAAESSCHDSKRHLRSPAGRTFGKTDHRLHRLRGRNRTAIEAELKPKVIDSFDTIGGYRIRTSNSSLKGCRSLPRRNASIRS